MTVPVVCIACGSLTPRNRSGRCPSCRGKVDRQRQQRRGDRYGSQHRRLRREWAPLVATGQVPCARGALEGSPHLLDASERWHLDHLDDGSEAPSCEAHNSAATSRRRA